MAEKIVTVEEYMAAIKASGTYTEDMLQLLEVTFEVGNISGWHEGYHECLEDYREVARQKLDATGF